MLKHLSVTEKAYIAGFLDGDGSIYVRAKPNSTYRYGFQIAPYVVFFQSAKDRKNFEQLCSVIGYGKIRERKDGIIEYVISRIDNIKDFLFCVRPYVKLKKEQLELMLEIMRVKKNVNNSNDFSKLLKLIEKYRSLNYSKKRIKRVLTP
ncbi:MAG: Homing endonuclease [Parcubacteria group bacterium GW2011_GWA2_42_35]|nr:MAG: LAGLIDADG homing endonuclease [Parcubacteria group bacterium GW2011_GWC2_42_13]KKS56663.1 MAG: Homing endonuclease [Parcubacteria group bacterium GW2011_GWA2_42_35]